MSSNTLAGKRYAKALFEVAREQKVITEVERELKGIVQFIEEDKSFNKFISHPNIGVDTKKELLGKAFEGKVSDIVLHTVQLLIERGRGPILTAIYEYYVGVANEFLGQADAVVYTPSKLSDDELKDVEERFGKLTGKQINASNEVDSGLLGGLKVRIGDRLYDGSLAGKLAALEKELKHQAI
ncbi:F0F1 ATP synthase subunit delta [Chengkuizengella axinellae]|uniref:ATP synthase subunit delta n=1 Tax=Chengkuizengella axinellae TaxID=3064388 RepID=A0ABT9J728_9BACL|nr:F0F1 ATP synthase subunit delta [Chengkuizengella sp. 2205SS18-9]MDP5276825.1 F0F1 ATP synthase subunit delta [Chengkuizengella sp. 2205SS18-9]